MLQTDKLHAEVKIGSENHCGNLKNQTAFCMSLLLYVYCLYVYYVYTRYFFEVISWLHSVKIFNYKKENKRHNQEWNDRLGVTLVLEYLTSDGNTNTGSPHKRPLMLGKSHLTICCPQVTPRVCSIMPTVTVESTWLVNANCALQSGRFKWLFQSYEISSKNSKVQFTFRTTAAS